MILFFLNLEYNQGYSWGMYDPGENFFMEYFSMQTIKVTPN